MVPIDPKSSLVTLGQQKVKQCIMCDICKLFLNYPKQIKLIGALTALPRSHRNNAIQYLLVGIPPIYLNILTKITSSKSMSIIPFYFKKLLTGIFFVLPCIESYQKVDLRTITLGVPPQEVISCHCCISTSCDNIRS